MARIFRKLAQLLDVDLTSTPPSDGDALTYDQGSDKWIPGAGGGGGGAPTDVNYLVGTADSGLSAEIVVGTTPGGELGGTWASPTVDATHSGSSHASVQAAAEATAASALSAHASDTTGIHGISDTSALLDTGDIGSSVAAQSHVHAGEDITSGTVADARIASTIARDSEVTAAIATSESGQVRDGDAAGGVLGGTYPNPSFAADMATQAELDAHVNDTSAAHAASAVSFTPTGNLAATDAQAAIAEAATDAAAALSTHESDTTSVHGITDTSTLYRSGGTDVALADGGTGASLSDPNADRILFWDDSGGGVTWLTPGTNLTITSTTIDAAGGSGELDYAEITSELTVSGSSGAPTNVITGASIALDGSTTIYIEFFTAGLLPGSQALIVEAYEDSTLIGRIIQTGAGSGQHPAFGSVRRTPSAGSHTYSIKAWKNSGTDGNISAQAGTFTPAFMRVRKA